MYMNKISRTTFYIGQKDVVSKGTPVQLPTQAVTDGADIIVKAKIDNTGTIYIGTTSDNAKNDSGNNWTLLPGDYLKLSLTNVNKFWIDGEDGEGVEIATVT